jgi:alkylated DNA nucleotide flippase Atl1
MEAAGSFDSTKTLLQLLLQEIDAGKVQLPDFQRGWVWDDEHVRSLLASVSLSFPIGAVMLLETGNPAVKFKPRFVEGVKPPATASPGRLILDGQQRLTSLYQALMMKDDPVLTFDPNKAKIKVFYYIDLTIALDPKADREEAVFAVPSDRIVRYRGEARRDLTTIEKECEAEALPVRAIFDLGHLTNWMLAYIGDGSNSARRSRWNQVVKQVIQPFQQYQVPLIVLTKETGKEAVCKVFEKVNTGGVSLNVFELLTATYAADNHNLREDWEGIPGDTEHTGYKARLHSWPVLKDVENTDLLQVVALLSTLNRKRANIAAAVGCKRKDILDLDLAEYKRWAAAAMAGFIKSVEVLHRLRIFLGRDVPYRTQLVPLAAIFADLADSADNEGVQAKIRRWLWCGILGELYGGSIESRFARDVPQVLEWVLAGGPEPDTVAEANFRKERLLTLRTRNSAAYKGVHALLMADGAQDLLSGSPIDSQLYVKAEIDIHHIFPKRWCSLAKVPVAFMDSVINKTPLSKATNMVIGGSAPSRYVPALETKAHLDSAEMDDLLRTHLVDPAALRADDFATFFRARAATMVERIEKAMGKPVAGAAVDFIGVPISDGESEKEGDDELTIPSGPTILVEGGTDEDYLRVAAEICDRPDLLDGLEIEPCGGVTPLVERALLLRAQNAGPLLALFDKDVNGRAGKDQLINKFKFDKQQVFTYGEFVDGNPDGIEAEDLWPQALLEGFVDTYGEITVLAEKVFHPQLKAWHYGFNAAGKTAIVGYLRENASGQDAERFVRLLETMRTRLGLPSKPVPSPYSLPKTSVIEAPETIDSDTPEPADLDVEGEPWKTNGRSWHLEKRSSATTRPITEGVVDLITAAVPDADGPDWGQRRYISWKADGRIWLAVIPRQSAVWVEFSHSNKQPADIASELGYVPVHGHGSARWVSPNGTAHVRVSWRGRPVLKIESAVDLTGESGQRLAEVLKPAYEEAIAGPPKNVGPKAGKAFDWSLIDAAVEALPPAHWTTYADLAELGGTAPMQVGQRLGAVPLENGHRVLDASGRIRPGFHWVEPSDTRDVREVLASEGVRFDATGAADPTQRMTTTGLAELVGVEPPEGGDYDGLGGSRGDLYLAFWSLLLDRLHLEYPGWSAAKKPPNVNWMVIKTIGFTSVATVFATGHRLRTELYVDSGDATTNLALFDRLQEAREELQDAYGRPLEWEDLPARRACRIADYTVGHITHRGEYLGYLDWFVDSLARWQRVLGKVAPQLKA